MRQIKFRLWDEKEEKMGEPFSTDAGTITQFTGVYDIHHREIYDGDILRDDGRVALVEWDELNARWCCLTGTVKPWNQCEVIGNKFENPELLLVKVGSGGSGGAIKH